MGPFVVPLRGIAVASVLYPAFKEQILQAGVNLSTANVKVALFDVTDDPYDAANVFLSDLVAGAIVATSGNLASKTFTGGVFDAADVTFTAVTGDPAEALIVYVDTGVTTTSRLVAFIDRTAGDVQLTVTPNGGDIQVQFDAAGIFAL